MDTKQKQKLKSISQNTALKTNDDGTENPLKLIPLDYLSLILVLAPLFGYQDSENIAEFWNENRKVLREIYSDFPDFDISEDTVKKILMTVCAWDMVDLNGYTYWLESLFNANDKFIEAEKKSAGQPIDIRNGTSSYSCLFETPMGIVFGRKLTGRRKSKYWHERSLPDFVYFNDTVVTWNLKDVEMSNVSKLIGLRADYFLPVANKKSSIFEKIQKAFENFADDAKEISKIIENKDGTTLERSIRIIPSTVLDAETKYFWAGLEDGCLLKATFKKGKRSKGQEVYFISSFPFKLSNIEDLAPRAIWQYWDVKEWLDEVVVFDCRLDMGAFKNSTYIKSCHELENFADRITFSVSKEYMDDFRKASEKHQLHVRRKAICAILEEISNYYVCEEEEEAKRYFDAFF